MAKCWRACHLSWTAPDLCSLHCHSHRWGLQESVDHSDVRHALLVMSTIAATSTCRALLLRTAHVLPYVCHILKAALYALGKMQPYSKGELGPHRGSPAATLALSLSALLLSLIHI